MDEFSLIKTLFQPLETLENSASSTTSSFLRKIGDDAAVWKGQGNLAFSIDTLVEGVHFTPDIPPKDLGYRCLAVNLSDLAAMAAAPSFFTLAVTLPSIDQPWLTEFVAGMTDLASKYEMPLVGGDTTRGPLTITIQAHGLCPQPVYRSGAQLGDDLYVSGYLGDAAAGLSLWLEQSEVLETSAGRYLLERFHRPTARIELGLELSRLAHSMLDVSDGLVADVQHIAEESQCCIEIDASALPYSNAMLALVDDSQAQDWALSGGDDYELAFTAPTSNRRAIEQLSKNFKLPVTRIGTVYQQDAQQSTSKVYGERIRIINSDRPLKKLGFNHFNH